MLTVQNQLQSVTENWVMDLVRQDGHVYTPWDETFETLFSREQLTNLQLHFMHPSTDKLYDLLKKAHPNTMSKHAKDVLSDISRSCHACQIYSTKPITFQVRFPDEVVFNKEIRIDLFFLDQAPVLSIVDVGTNFATGRFLHREDTATIWNTFLYSWVCMYAGFPFSMLTDQGSVFMSKEWEEKCKNALITLRHTGTESHNSLGFGETYHALIRRVFNVVSVSYPSEPRELRLALSVKAVNDTAGPQGLVPSLLVFGVIPKT